MTCKISLCVVILTLNEERHIERAIASVRCVASDIVVVDSYSTDRTVELAHAAGARILQNRFESQSQQFSWTMERAGITADWIMRLDADEYIEPDLAARLQETLTTLPTNVSGINLKRRHIFMGRWIRHGGRYPLVLLRVWRRGMAKIENRWMDEHMVLSSGRAVTLDGGFCDHNLNDLTYFTDKHNKYATREAIDVLNKKYSLFDMHNGPSTESSSYQASAKRWIKESIYNRLPFWLGPLSYFVFRYFIQLGFLDGREGLIYHSLQCLWYRFLVGAKVEELDLVIRTLPDRDSQLNALSKLTGYWLGPSK
jgi:glycosyltransferase involved in cell wall biosynthesis